jgi:predicted Zn-dependent protease with MMP-like domain
MKGPLAPPTVPLVRSRAVVFDDLVLATVDRVGRHMPDDLAQRLDLDRVEVVVADFPADDALAGPGGVPMGAAVPADPPGQARLVVYRRPVESHASGPGDLEQLLRHVVVAQVAELLGVRADDVDPGAPGA